MLLLLVVLFFADLMVFLLISYIIYHLSWAVIGVWLLVPPLTQPLAAITGAIFAITEQPRLGRLFATAAAFGIANSAFLLMAVLWFFRDSWYFDSLELITAAIIKVALLTCANVHISNLEIANDLRFMEISQAEANFMMGNNVPDVQDSPRSSLDHDNRKLSSGSLHSTPESLLEEAQWSSTHGSARGVAEASTSSPPREPLSFFSPSPF